MYTRASLQNKPKTSEALRQAGGELSYLHTKADLLRLTNPNLDRGTLVSIEGIHPRRAGAEKGGVHYTHPLKFEAVVPQKTNEGVNAGFRAGDMSRKGAGCPGGPATPAKPLQLSNSLLDDWKPTRGSSVRSLPHPPTERGPEFRREILKRASP